jgi:hypothetical protein
VKMLCFILVPPFEINAFLFQSMAGRFVFVPMCGSWQF